MDFHSVKRQIRTLVCTVRLLKPMDNIGYFPRRDWHLVLGKINISEQFCQIRNIYDNVHTWFFPLAFVKLNV